MSDKFEIGDRVTKADKPTGLRGTIVDIRLETCLVSTYSIKREIPFMVYVLWDNSTRSVFSPATLKKFK
jgi:hypothetical protein